MSNVFQDGINCTSPAINDFPKDLFTTEERQNGAVIFHIAIALYLFVALAIICGEYFVPAVKKICQALNMSDDVAAVTFMAVATSAPELFVNVIGTFITDTNIGFSTIIGSAVFNILAVAACCGLCAVTVVNLHWWPLTRDCIVYGITVALLIYVVRDEKIYWYEALVFILMYTVYIVEIYWDKKIQEFFGIDMKQIPSGDNDCDGIKTIGREYYQEAEKIIKDNSSHGSAINQCIDSKKENQEKFGILHSLSYPFEGSWKKILMWIIASPIYVAFFLTILDCKRKRFEKWFPLTFIICIFWIGSMSYVVAWMITTIGSTIMISDIVMGITILAAGISVPEAVSSVILARQGHASMGISNSLGSNTVDILLCLGLPWFIKASFLPTNKAGHFIKISSVGMEYCAICLLSTILLFYGTFAANKFKLDKKVGFVCLFMYIIFVVSLTVLNMFFVVNLPTCK